MSIHDSILIRLEELSANSVNESLILALFRKKTILPLFCVVTEIHRFAFCAKQHRVSSVIIGNISRFEE
jgi:hypothetical protein